SPRLVGVGRDPPSVGRKASGNLVLRGAEKALRRSWLGTVGVARINRQYPYVPTRLNSPLVESDTRTIGRNRRRRNKGLTLQQLLRFAGSIRAHRPKAKAGFA